MTLSEDCPKQGDQDSPGFLYLPMVETLVGSSGQRNLLQDATISNLQLKLIFGLLLGPDTALLAFY
jgi:hypothetical protein